MLCYVECWIIVSKSKNVKITYIYFVRFTLAIHLKCKHNVEILCCFSSLVFSAFMLCVVLSVCCRFIALDVSLLMFDRDMNCILVKFSFFRCYFLCFVGCSFICMKSSISSDIMPCSTVKSSRSFEGVCFMLVSSLEYLRLWRWRRCSKHVLTWTKIESYESQQSGMMCLKTSLPSPWRKWFTYTLLGHWNLIRNSARVQCSY